MLCLAALKLAPKDFLFSGESDFRPAWSAVSSPDLPRKRALAFSSDAASLAALNAASARETMPSSSSH